ncbi:MAG: HNH endonuclease [Mariniphaga sp.]
MNFTEFESNFYQYLKKHGNISPRTSTNYISWLRFLSNDYSIDKDLDEVSIKGIIAQERVKKEFRSIYKSVKDLNNFSAALKKYITFMEFDFELKTEKTIENEILKIEVNTKLTATEKSILMLARIGQGKYRKQLIEYWNGCSVSGFKRFDLLVASHIKPWKDSNNFERIDVYNGLLLLPNYDKLFDRGFINFDNNGKILISKLISKEDQEILRIDDKLKLSNLEANHKKYLEYHRENYFMM